MLITLGRAALTLFSIENIATSESQYRARGVDSLHREISRRIEQAAKRKKWSHNQLADFAGVGRGYLSEMMRGKKSPTVRMLAKIAAALEVSVRDLLPP